VVELREEVTRARAATIMAGTRATWVERVAKERAILLASTCIEVDEVVQRVSLLEGELVATRRAWDTAKVKLLSLVDKEADADRLRE
jgi:hypothetical protein